MTEYTPNDPEFGKAWHPQTMNLPDARNVTRVGDIRNPGGIVPAASGGRGSTLDSPGSPADPLWHLMLAVAAAGRLRRRQKSPN